MARLHLPLPCPRFPTLAGSSWSLFLTTFTQILGSGRFLGKQPKSRAPFNTRINVHSFITIQRHRAYDGALGTQSPYILEGEAQDYQAEK